MNWIRVFGFLPVVFVLVACQQLEARNYRKTGWASYYADKFHGRTTASGEKFNMWAMTAAHKTLPFGTKVKVTNLSNHKSVVVRINDRGPYRKNRIIDLSKGAAAKIGLIQAGTAKVKVEVVSKASQTGSTKGKKRRKHKRQPKEKSGFLTAKTYSLWGTEKFPEGWGIQIASFRNLDNAKATCKRAIARGIKETYIQVGWKGHGHIYRVIVGQYLNRNKAKRKIRFYKRHGFKGIPAKHFK